MKAWESMTNAERAAQTYRDIKLRQERRRAGVREANNFMFNNILKAKRNRDKITAKSIDKGGNYEL